jgi:hypothetical protein
MTDDGAVLIALSIDTEKIPLQGKWRFPRFWMWTLQRAGVEGASGKPNPSVVGTV